MSLERNQIYHLDAFELLAGLEPASVDFVFSDLPYGTTAIKWDVEIDLDKWWNHMERVMKPDGVVVMTGSQPFTSRLVMSKLAWFRYEWIWYKNRGTGHLNANRMPMKYHENVLVFYQNAGRYNPQLDIGTPYTDTSGKAGQYVRDKNTAGHTTVNTGTRHPTSVRKFNAVQNPIHPTQKPVLLVEYMIETYTKLGDLCVDPFCGSGTTAEAARNTGRDYIVGDRKLSYVEKARDRLAAPYTLDMFRMNNGD